MSTKTIAMVVLNSISHDARVKKSAESLSKNAYKVFIIGVQDNRDSRPMNFLPNGTNVVRVDIQTPIKEFKTLIRPLFWAICLITLTLVIYTLSITWMGTFLATTTINLDLIIAYIMWVGIAFSLYFFIKTILIFNRFPVSIDNLLLLNENYCIQLSTELMTNNKDLYHSCRKFPSH